MFEYAKDELKLIRRGSRPIDRLRLAGMSLWFHLTANGASLPGARRVLELRLDGIGALRARASDYFAIFELFGLDGYDIDLSPIGPVATVLDVGANIGLATIFLSRRHSAAPFRCAEPAMGSFALLQANLARNVPGADAVHAAALAEPGRVQIDAGRFPALNRVRAAAPGSGVRGATILQLLDEAEFARVDRLKLDVESRA